MNLGELDDFYDAQEPKCTEQRQLTTINIIQ